MPSQILILYLLQLRHGNGGGVLHLHFIGAHPQGPGPGVACSQSPGPSASWPWLPPAGRSKWSRVIMDPGVAHQGDPSGAGLDATGDHFFKSGAHPVHKLGVGLAVRRACLHIPLQPVPKVQVVLQFRSGLALKLAELYSLKSSIVIKLLRGKRMAALSLHRFKGEVNTASTSGYGYLPRRVCSWLILSIVSGKSVCPIYCAFRLPLVSPCRKR